MVLKKRIDYGFRDFQVPSTARRLRSARRKVLFKKPTEDGQACAIELLACLAGKLLQVSESSACSSASEGNHQPAFSQGIVEQERQEEIKPLTAEGIHHGSCAESTFMTEVVSQESCQKLLEHAETDCVLECNFGNDNNKNISDEVEVGVKSVNFKWGNEFGHHSNRLVEVTNNFRESSDGNIKNGFRQEQEPVRSGIKGSSLDNKSSLKDPLELCVNPPALVDSNSNVKYPLCRGLFPNASFSGHGNDNKLGFRDDDENFLRCKKVCTKSKAFKPPQHFVRRRIRHLLTSKYWKVAPKLKDCEHSRADKGVKPLYHKRKTCYSVERSRHGTLANRRKFIDRGSVITSDGGLSSDSVSNSPEKGIEGDNPRSSSKLHVSKDSHVKFSIKSFRIPELYLELPKTTTVGSLKRTVMEAVMAIVGGGVHVGVHVKGKKVRDDNSTLRQTGLSCKENLDKLGFMLEPSSLQASSAVCVGDPSQCQPSRSSENPVIDSGITDALQDLSLLTNTGNLLESNQSTWSPTETIADKVTSDVRALVTVPATTPEALAVVPVSQKTRRSEFVQRRTRRPFSVSEVEALVQAVEELGTGRWRDVKMRAFENADYRTYVDLKDKWKTLVHTTKISPQQRRGEPVPQELLDRVLAAHAYWSNHQAKQQHGKHQAGTLKIREESAERQC